MALTSIPSVKTPAATSSGPNSPPVLPAPLCAWRIHEPDRMASATATDNPTSTSLWPLPTEWNRNTGFHATRATAKGARSGHRRVATLATTRTSAVPAMPARTLNAQTSATSPRNALVMAALSIVKAGPYTGGVSLHAGPTRGKIRSPRNAVGTKRYGLAWCSDWIRP